MFLFYVLAALAGLCGSFGDAFLNEGVKGQGDGRTWWVVGGFIFWNLATAFFMAVLKSNTMTQCVVVFLIVNCSVVLLMDQVWFKEPIAPAQWFWIAIGLIAIIGMELSKPSLPGN